MTHSINFQFLAQKPFVLARASLICCGEHSLQTWHGLGELSGNRSTQIAPKVRASPRPRCDGEDAGGGEISSRQQLVKYLFSLMFSQGKQHGRGSRSLGQGMWEDTQHWHRRQVGHGEAQTLWGWRMQVQLYHRFHWWQGGEEGEKHAAIAGSRGVCAGEPELPTKRFPATG